MWAGCRALIPGRGISPIRSRGGAVGHFVGRVLQSSAKGVIRGHALRHALEPVRQPLARIARYRIDEASEVAGRGVACHGLCREQLHRKPANLGFFCARRRFLPCGMKTNPLRLSTASRWVSWCRTYMRGRARSECAGSSGWIANYRLMGI